MESCFKKARRLLSDFLNSLSRQDSQWYGVECACEVGERVEANEIATHHNLVGLVIH